jgi:hypothetical protein
MEKCVHLILTNGSEKKPNEFCPAQKSENTYNQSADQLHWPSLMSAENDGRLLIGHCHKLKIFLHSRDNQQFILSW